MMIYRAPKPPPRQPKERKRLKARNDRRHKAEWLREYESKERMGFVKSLPCATAHFGCRLPSENAHIESGGKGRKADADKIAPLCEMHHHQLHTIGRQSFERIYAIDLAGVAAITESRWQIEKAA